MFISALPTTATARYRSVGNTSRLISKSRLSELDLNPVIIREDGYDVVDIRILR